MNTPLMPTEEPTESSLPDSQHNYKTTLARTMQKLTLYFDNNENNAAMLDSMTENLKNLKTLLINPLLLIHFSPDNHKIVINIRFFFFCIFCLS
jgi:hypothetical protein